MWSALLLVSGTDVHTAKKPSDNTGVGYYSRASQTGSCSLVVSRLTYGRRILLLNRKLLRTHNASKILLGFGLAKCVVADRILHGSDLHMRAYTFIAFISSRVYRSMVYTNIVLNKDLKFYTYRFRRPSTMPPLQA